MAVPTYTKTGTKAETEAKLDKSIFGQTDINHQLLQDAYLAYQSSGRTNLAKTKRRGEVRGGGRKPWRQKGTGQARFGSRRNPIWRGGGVAFGPTGYENYQRKIGLKTKRQALRQALSLAANSDKISVIETFDCSSGQVKPTISLLQKIGTKGSVLLVVSQKDELVDRATRNLDNVQAVAANYLTVFDVLNADSIVLSKKAVEIIHAWLGQKTTVREASK